MLLFVLSAFAGVLGLSASSPALLRVDGESVPTMGTGPAWMELAPDRLHVIEARTTSDRPLATIELATPADIEVQVEWRGRNFAVTGIRAARPESVAAARGAGMGTIILQLGAPPMSAAPAPTPTPTQDPPPPVYTGPVVVELLPKDTEWSNVWIDGEKVAEFRVGDTKKSISLAPGPHRVEVRDFMETDTWVTGTLLVAAPGPMKFGFKEGQAEVYTDPKAWTVR
jgi:hypothetical protein